MSWQQRQPGFGKTPAVTRNPTVECSKPHGHPTLAAQRAVAEDDVRQKLVREGTTCRNDVLLDIGSGSGGMSRAVKSAKFKDYKGYHHCMFPVSDWADFDRVEKLQTLINSNAIKYIGDGSDPVRNKVNYCHHSASECTCMQKYSKPHAMSVHSLYYFEREDYAAIAAQYPMFYAVVHHTEEGPIPLEKPEYMVSRSESYFTRFVNWLQSKQDSVKMVPICEGGTCYEHRAIQPELRAGGRYFDNRRRLSNTHFLALTTAIASVTFSWRTTLLFLAGTKLYNFVYDSFPNLFATQTVRYYPCSQVTSDTAEPSTFIWRVASSFGYQPLVKNELAKKPVDCEPETLRHAQMLEMAKKSNRTSGEVAEDMRRATASIMRSTGKGFDEVVKCVKKAQFQTHKQQINLAFCARSTSLLRTISENVVDLGARPTLGSIFRKGAIILTSSLVVRKLTLCFRYGPRLGYVLAWVRLKRSIQNIILSLIIKASNANVKVKAHLERLLPDGYLRTAIGLTLARLTSTMRYAIDTLRYNPMYSEPVGPYPNCSKKGHVLILRPISKVILNGSTNGLVGNARRFSSPVRENSCVLSEPSHLSKPSLSQNWKILDSLRPDSYKHTLTRLLQLSSHLISTPCRKALLILLLFLLYRRKCFSISSLPLDGPTRSWASGLATSLQDAFSMKETAKHGIQQCASATLMHRDNYSTSSNSSVNLSRSARRKEARIVYENNSQTSSSDTSQSIPGNQDTMTQRPETPSSTSSSLSTPSLTLPYARPRPTDYSQETMPSSPLNLQVKPPRKWRMVSS